MLKNNPTILNLIYEDSVVKLANIRGITLDESKSELIDMSFSDYITLIEASANITPPSGQTISPSSGNIAPQSTPITPGSNRQTQPGTVTPQSSAQTANQPAPIMWKGPGTPAQQGMTVGLRGPTGQNVAGEITQVDQNANGVKVKNPTTGQEEWHSNDELQQYTPDSNANTQQMSEEIARMRHLAGISENCSAGATGAGSIAVSPAPLGNVRRRTIPETSMDEYTPTVAKTVVGDTKPKQDSGKLSARLAKAGKPTATRSNNGFKK